MHKVFSRDMVYTLRVKFQDNQGVVQFRNSSDKTAQWRNDKAVRILDLRSIGYCKAQPRCALLGYPFCNIAAHMEATPTREGI